MNPLRITCLYLESPTQIAIIWRIRGRLKLSGLRENNDNLARNTPTQQTPAESGGRRSIKLKSGPAARLAQRRSKLL